MPDVFETTSALITEFLGELTNPLHELGIPVSIRHSQ